MKQNFKIIPLKSAEFSPLFHMSDADLRNIGAVRMVADKKPGFPCRVSLEDAEIGEDVILLPYQHHQVQSPYQAVGPIFVRKCANTTSLEINDIPLMLTTRMLSVRAYNNAAMMVEAVVTEGRNLKETVERLFENQDTSYLHIHNAKPGCYNCRVERASPKI
jgi:hypothetical protein